MHSLVTLPLFLSTCFALPQFDFKPEKGPIHFSAQPDRAQAVKDAFNFAWSGYMAHAFPSDELLPANNSYGNSRNGWGASAVDALSTAILMKNKDVVNTILDHIETLDWSVTDDEVSVFETTIRYLGGMVSGYDLLTGPYTWLGIEKRKVDVLLSQAMALADNLVPAFTTPTGIPDNRLNITSGTKLSTDGKTGLAVAGSLVLEWTRLADLTGIPQYAELVQKAETYLLRPQYANNLSEPFPGLEGTDISLSSGLFLDVDGSWGGGTDSFYEYLIKQWLYDPKTFEEYRERWIAAADSTIKYLASSPNTRPDLVFPAGWDGQSLKYKSQHLAGFIGGNLLLAGLTLGDERFTDYGLRFTSSFHDTYTSDTPRIGPEAFQWFPAECSHIDSSNYSAPEPSCDGDACAVNVDEIVTTPQPGACIVPTELQSQNNFYAQSGFYVTDSHYNLRPEVLESYYYAYRITGDRKYQDWAWDAFTAITSACKVGSGFTAIEGLNSPGGGVSLKPNMQESFFFAEVLKYAYMIFADVDAEWQVNCDGEGGNSWVFNTEAHPFKVRSYDNAKRRWLWRQGS